MHANIQRVLVLGLLWSATALALAGQPAADAPETLKWVEKQGQKIESALHDAVRSNDQAYMVLQMHRAWREFDAVAQAGLYCHAARVAAERGRWACDLLNLDRKKDLSNLVIRATEAREEAFRMQKAAEVCRAEVAELSRASKRYLPSDLLLRDVIMAELDLSDAKASGDFHILAQKIEHALRLLRDAEYLASTLDNCTEVQNACLQAMDACRDALSANTWDAAGGHVHRAMERLQTARRLAEGCK